MAHHELIYYNYGRNFYFNRNGVLPNGYVWIKTIPQWFNKEINLESLTPEEKLNMILTKEDIEKNVGIDINWFHNCIRLYQPSLTTGTITFYYDKELTYRVSEEHLKRLKRPDSDSLPNYILDGIVPNNMPWDILKDLIFVEGINFDNIDDISEYDQNDYRIKHHINEKYPNICCYNKTGCKGKNNYCYTSQLLDHKNKLVKRKYRNENL